MSEKKRSALVDNWFLRNENSIDDSKLDYYRKEMLGTFSILNCTLLKQRK